MQRDMRVEELDQTNSSSEGQWLDVLDASTALGLSPATLRRYIKRKKLQSRKLGRTANAKIQVFVTPDLLNQNHDDQISMEGLEDVLTAETDYDSEDNNSSVDQVDYANRETMRWMRERLDEQDLKLEDAIRERDEKIEKLTNQLQSAIYRNGYLEAKYNSTEEQLKLLVDKSNSILEKEEAINREAKETERSTSTSTSTSTSASTSASTSIPTPPEEITTVPESKPNGFWNWLFGKKHS